MHDLLVDTCIIFLENIGTPSSVKDEGVWRWRWMEAKVDGDGGTCILVQPSIVYEICQSNYKTMTGAQFWSNNIHQVWSSWRIFPCVAHFCKCGTLSQVWRTFSSVALFKISEFFEMCRTFPSVPYFSKYALLFQVWPIFSSEPYFSKCAAFFRSAAFFHWFKWLIFPRLTFFSSVTNCSNCYLIFKCYLLFKTWLWPIFQVFQVCFQACGCNMN